VSLFRKREPLHVRLAREGGMPLEDDDAPRAPWNEVGIHGIQRAPEWDVVETVEAPELPGDRAVFVSLPDGTLIVEEGPDRPEQLATAVERELASPYRAEGVKREGGLWAVGAKRIELVELPGIGGEEIELSSHADDRVLVVDGERGFGTVPQLERPGYHVRARRVDGDLWEVEAAPL
jgi:hypothetical protein